MRCKHCGYEAPHDIEECEKESKYKIEEMIHMERAYGPFDPEEMESYEAYFGLIAGKLMKKWFGED